MLRAHFVHSIFNLLPDDFISSRRVRPALLRTLGVDIGEKTIVLHGSWFAAGPRGRVRIGKECYISRKCTFGGPGRITLEDNVSVSFGVVVLTAEHAIGDTKRRCGPASGKDVTIGEGSFIGANVLIMPGVRIGRGCVVGAGAVVTESLPDDVIAAGVPAKVLRKL